MGFYCQCSCLTAVPSQVWVSCQPRFRVTNPLSVLLRPDLPSVEYRTKTSLPKTLLLLLPLEKIHHIRRRERRCCFARCFRDALGRNHRPMPTRARFSLRYKKSVRIYCPQGTNGFSETGGSKGGRKKGRKVGDGALEPGGGGERSVVTVIVGAAGDRAILGSGDRAPRTAPSRRRRSSMPRRRPPGGPPTPSP